MNEFSWKRTLAFLSGFYFLSHLYRLTLLPIFADEAIYIRWAQLIIDDWKQYLFFPLNDGKTPLFIWLMIPFQFLFANQLYAARFVAVLVGFGQMLVNGSITHKLGGNKKTASVVMFLTAILPFWYFHHRMALIDGLLALTMSLTVLFTIESQQRLQVKKWLKDKTAFSFALLAGFCFGLSLWTKLPAILIITALPAYIFLGKKIEFKNSAIRLSMISVSIIFGFMIFGILKLNPAFGQLFNRGNDFLFPLSEVLLHGKWMQTIQNIPTYITYFGTYLTWPLLLVVLIGLFAKNLQKQQHILFWSALSFAGPIALLGRVVYPRYFFPAIIFLTIGAGLSLEDMVIRFNKMKSNFKKQMLFGFFLTLLFANIVAYSVNFIFLSLTNPDQLTLVSADKIQYLYEWSSGHGITQAVDFIREQAKDHTVAVATEGSFGTLPDALLVYFHRTDVSNIYIEGIGYPVKAIDPKFATKAKDFDQRLLVVNSHRLEIKDDRMKLLAEYCRPDNAPCLQIWDITNLPLFSEPIAKPTNSL